MEYHVGRVRNADQERTRLNEILRDIQRRFSLTETQTEDLRRQIGGITGVSGIVTSVNGNTGDVTITIQSIGGVPVTREINTTNSLTGGGNLSANRTLQLVGDVATPGPNQVYGTDGTGAKGWKADPAGGGQVDTIVAGDGIDVDATDPANPEVSVLLSTDPGNTLSFGTDDGLFASGGGSLSFPAEDMTAGGTLDAGTRAAICDETGVTLPAAPADGAFVHLRNVGTAATIGRNGENIDGAAADYTLAAGASVLLVYDLAEFGGWRSFPGSGGGGGGSSDGGPIAVIGSIGGPPLQVGASIEARTPVGYTALSDWILDIFPTGSLQLDVLVNGSSITGSGQPEVTAGTSDTGDTSAWSATSIARNDIVRFEVLTVADGVEWLNITLNGTRT